MIGKIQKTIVIRYAKYERKVGWIVKWYERYGRKPGWIVKRNGKYGRNPGWIVKRYGKYGRKASWIEKRYGKYWRKDMENWKVSRIVKKTEKYRRKQWQGKENMAEM